MQSVAPVLPWAVVSSQPIHLEALPLERIEQLFWFLASRLGYGSLPYEEAARIRPVICEFPKRCCCRAVDMLFLLEKENRFSIVLNHIHFLR